MTRLNQQSPNQIAATIIAPIFPLVSFELQQSIETYLIEMVTIRNGSLHSLDAYGRDICAFIQFLSKHIGEKIEFHHLSALAPLDFRAYLSQRSQDGVSRTSLVRAFAAMRGLFSALEEKKWVSNKAIARFKLSSPPRPLPRALTIEQSLQSLEAAPSLTSSHWIGLRDFALFSLIYGAGLRISESLKLTQGDWQGVSMGSNLRISGKGKRERLVPILPTIDEAVKRYRAVIPFSLQSTDPLFIGARGKSLNPSIVQKQFRQLRQLLNLPENATPHALRHSFATHLLKAGGNLRAIQELLGHQGIRTTQVYTKIELEELQSTHRKTHPRA